jgi:hypothetical protein
MHLESASSEPPDEAVGFTLDPPQAAIATTQLTAATASGALQQ